MARRHSDTTLVDAEHRDLAAGQPASDTIALEKGKVEQVEQQRDADRNLVTFAPNDPDDPRNFSLAWKTYLTVLAPTLNVLACIGVSGYSTGSEQIQEEFGASAELVTAGLSLFILGFAIGPLLAGPLSEFFGRRPVYLVAWFIFFLFQIPLAVAQNIRTILVCRFFQGFAGSTPLANTGGTIHDLWSRDSSGWPMAVYTLSSVIGPPVGNAVGGFISQQKGWRWLYWVNMAIFGGVWIIMIFTLRETRDRVILRKRAARLRKETGNQELYAPMEKQMASRGYFWRVTIFRAIKFLLTEPIVAFAAVWNGFLFGVIFIFNEAFPLVFGSGGTQLGGGTGHGWTSTGLINLTFLSIVVGGFIGFSMHGIQERAYQKRLAANDGKSVPEARIWLSLWLVWLMPIGLIIAAFTSYSFIVFIAPLIGAGLFGVGFYATLEFILNYTSDAYGHYAASALSAVVFVRNVIGAATPLFANYMFLRLTNQGALLFIAIASLCLCPINFWVYYRGRKLRYASPYCREHFDEDS